MNTCRLSRTTWNGFEFRNGTLISAELGQGNKGVNYILRKPSYTMQSWIDRVQGWLEQTVSRNNQEHTYEVHERDEAGFRALSDLRSQGICHVATALAQSTDHILSFFNMLRLELGFYVGCLNLRDQLVRKRESLCFPEPLPADRPMLTCQGLYDVCLSLRMEERVVGNDVTGDDMSADHDHRRQSRGEIHFPAQHGPGTAHDAVRHVRAGGIVQANLCDGIFTHFKREEDASMKSGKLDEELSRMSIIVDKITPHSIVLFNESFASTNEREGSEIARQIVRALLEADVKVFYVTHMFDLAQGFYLAKIDDTLFLRAERLADGQRTFRLIPGEPLPTSYGEDLYRLIFGPNPRLRPRHCLLYEAERGDETCREDRPDFQLRYGAYACDYGMTPDQMLAHDKKCYPLCIPLTPYLFWVSRKWHEWGRLYPGEA